jgi:hypothetical protein
LQDFQDRRTAGVGRQAEFARLDRRLVAQQARPRAERGGRGDRPFGFQLVGNRTDAGAIGHDERGILGQRAGAIPAPQEMRAPGRRQKQHAQDDQPDFTDAGNHGRALPCSAAWGLRRLALRLKPLS